MGFVSVNVQCMGVRPIKIPFIYKGMEFIDSHSIFKDNLVISSISNYFNNSETPIICYKYSEGKNLAIYPEDSQFRRKGAFNFIVSKIYVDKCSRVP